MGKYGGVATFQITALWNRLCGVYCKRLIGWIADIDKCVLLTRIYLKRAIDRHTVTAVPSPIPTMV